MKFTNPKRALFSVRPVAGCLAVLVAAALMPGTAWGQVTSTWNGSTGNWTDAARWSTNPLFPNNGNGGQNYNVTIGAGDVTLNQNITVSGLTVSGGILRLSAAADLAGGTMALVQAGGTLSLQSNFNPVSRINPASTGLLAIDVAGFSTALDMTAAGSGAMYLGSTAGGSYNAATLAAGSGAAYRLGGGGGAFTITGSNVLTGANAVTVGFAGTGGAGSVILSGSNNYTGGTNIVNGTLVLGNNGSAGSGTITLAGGRLAAIGAVTINNVVNFNTTSFNRLEYGSLTITSDVALGARVDFAPQLGSVLRLDGVISGNVGIAKAADGVLALSGHNTFTGPIGIAWGEVRAIGTARALGMGDVNIFGGGMLRMAALSNLAPGARISLGGAGRLALEGDFIPPTITGNEGIIAIDTPVFGVNAGPLNMAVMGGGWHWLGSTTYGSYSAPTLGAGRGAIYRLGGGGGTLHFGLENLLTGNNHLHIGPGEGGFAIGTIHFTADQDFQGNTQINSGNTLILDAMFTGTGTITVRSGATLRGSGGTNGQIVVMPGGIFEPGSSPGSFSAGGISLSDGAVFNWDLGSASDLLNVTSGTFTGTGTGGVTFHFANAGGFVPGQYVLIDWTGASASGVDVADFVAAPGPITGTFQIVGNTLVFNAVPEPATWAMLAAAAGCGLCLMRRRGRARGGRDGHGGVA